MDERITLLYENDNFRTIVGTVGILVLLVAFTEMTLQTAVPLFLIFGAMMAHDVVDELYDLPEGTNLFVYGASIIAVGIYWMAVFPLPWVGGLFALVGLWFVFDGVTTIRYESAQTGPEFEYVSDLDDETGAGEMMLRMQTLNVVYQTLTDAPEPQTAPELATDVDLTESRVESALGYLESKGRVERVGNQYRAEPPLWGRATPIVDFLVWLPRRIVRPFRRVTANA